MIAITIDIDWAPDEIVDDVMSIVERAGVPITIFCTDPSTDSSGRSSNLSGRFGSHHELGLHPNFQYTGDYAAVFDRLMNFYPTAKGFRSHQGCSGWPISLEAQRRGLVYEASTTVFPVSLPPIRLYGNARDSYLLATRFMDAHLLDERGFDWTWASLKADDEVFNQDRLFIACFHPNILYYDMVTSEEYAACKAHYHEVRTQNSFRQKTPQGAMRLFLDLLNSTPQSEFTSLFAFGIAQGLWDRAAGRLNRP